jgi:hypothetical protein
MSALPPIADIRRCYASGHDSHEVSMSDFTNWLAQLSDALALQRTPECVRPIRAQIGVQHPTTEQSPPLSC